MQTLEWGPTGIAPHVYFKLSSDDREHLEQILKDHGIESVPDAFWADMEKAIARYKGWAELHEKSSPGRVRQNLSETLKQAELFQRALHQLDGNSIQLILGRKPNVLRCCRIAVRRLEKEMKKASELAQAYPRGGRLPEFHRQYLAADIAEAMRRHLKVKPSGTKARGSKSSLFSVLLEEFLAIATGTDVNSVRDLVAKVLKNEIRTVDAQGMVIYAPAGRAD